MAMPEISTADLLKLGAKIGDFAKAAIEHYAALTAAGIPIDADILGAFVETKLESFNPVIKNKTPLDAPTKAAMARFIAGVVFNLSK